jgi:hypothetical protein
LHFLHQLICVLSAAVRPTMQADSEGDDWQTPCEVCGRTYPHEHIRSMYSSQQQDSSDDAGDQ